MQSLVMPCDLFPKALELLLFANVFDRPYDLREPHLLVNKILFVRLEARFALLQRLIEVFDGKR